MTLWHDTRTGFTKAWLVLVIGFCLGHFTNVHSGEEQVLCDFESPESLKLIEARDKIKLVPEHVTQGKSAGKIPPGFKIYASSGTGLPADWSPYAQLQLDVFNPGAPSNVQIWIADDQGNDVHKRHNNAFPLRNGANKLTIHVGGLFRDEKGSGLALNVTKIQQLLIIFPDDVKEDLFIDNFVLNKGTGGKVETKLMLGFEALSEPGAKWSIEDWPEDNQHKTTTELSTEHVTEGKNSLKVNFRENGGAIKFEQFAQKDWSAFEKLDLDCFNPLDHAITISGWFRDEEAAPSDEDYWLRNNYATNVKPGKSTIHFPTGGFYRGEKGSGKFLDVSKMLSFCITTASPTVTTLYFDNLRLTKGAPEIAVPGLKAFAFGVKDGPTFPGFTKILKDTAYDEAKGFGWLGRQPGDARNYEHPDSLYCQFVRCAGGETFSVDLPNGEYSVYLVLDSMNYFEYSCWLNRAVEANGSVAFQESLTPDEYLRKKVFLHQDDEDLPGTDIWEKYIQKHFQPKTFNVKVTDGHLKLTFKGDSWGLTPCALVLYPADQKDAGSEWLAQLDQRRHDEFYTAFAEIVHPAEPKPAVAADEQSAGYVLFHRDLDKEVYFNSTPGGEPGDTKDGKIDWATTPGEYASADLSVYPLKDCGVLTIKASELVGPNGATIPPEALRVRAIRYKFKRVGSRVTCAFDYHPWLLVDFKDWKIPAGVTRRFWLTAKTPENAVPGIYKGKLTVNIAGGAREIPITLQVYPIALDEPQIPLGMYGGSSPSAGWWTPEVLKAFHLDERVEEVIRDQREHGMTAITPSGIRFDGFKDGKPQLEFKFIDQSMQLLRKYGFHQTCFTYAGMFQVHPGDLDADCRERYHLPLDQAIKLVYTEIGAHAKEMNWLPMAWALADEPLIHGIAPASVIRTFEAHRAAAPEMKFVSEDAMGDPSHYVVIPAIDIVSGNTPRYKVAEEVRKNKGHYWFNNIGRNRQTFGWFMWKARKELGVEALFQWGYSTNAGDIYYDLDGSEGDSGCSFTASEGQRPRSHWETIREGVNDHRYLETLARLIKKAQAGDNSANKEKAAEAGKFINDTMAKIELESKSKAFYSFSELDQLKRKLAEFILALQDAK